MKKVLLFLAVPALLAESFTYSRLPDSVSKAVSLKVPKGLALYGVIVCRDTGDSPISGGKVYQYAPFGTVLPELALIALRQERGLWGEVLSFASSAAPVGLGVAIAVGATPLVLGSTGGMTFITGYLERKAKKVGSLPPITLLGPGKLPLEVGECGHVLLAGTDPPSERLPVTKVPPVWRNSTVERPLHPGIFLLPTTPTYEIAIDPRKVLDIY